MICQNTSFITAILAFSDTINNLVTPLFILAVLFHLHHVDVCLNCKLAGSVDIVGISAATN